MILRFVAAAIAIALLGGCASTTGPAATGPKIVVTTSILGSLVEELAQGDADVSVLIGPGIDPHGYAPSAASARAIRGADLVVANGLGLEASLTDTLEAAEQDGANVLRLGELVDPRTFPGEDVPDPHFWLDPVRVRDVVGRLADALAATGASDVDWASRATAMEVDIDDLDREVSGILAVIPDEDRLLVTNHDAFGYFADRYDLEVIGTVIPGSSTQADTSAAGFADLAALIRSTGVRAIFTESSSSPRLSQALADEVGADVAVVTLYTESLGDSQTSADNYHDLMVTNARTIADALAPAVPS